MKEFKEASSGGNITDGIQVFLGNKWERINGKCYKCITTANCKSAVYLLRRHYRQNISALGREKKYSTEKFYCIFCSEF